MSRKHLIKALEDLRKSRAICYVTGDRAPFTTKIASDAVPLFEKHLRKIGKCNTLSLFLYTRGGDILAPLSIVKLLRNYCQMLEVIIPYHAHSAGTLLALGANKIVMGKMGELSPTDPSTGHPFNPQNPQSPQQKMEISVEDVNSYFLLAKERAGIRDQEMVAVFNQLSEKIHPLALGNIYRGYRMAKTLSEKLLKLHMKPKRDEKKIQKIIDHLTGLISIHNYPVTRDEAKDLGLNVEFATGGIEDAIWAVYESYAEEMELGKPYNPLMLLGEENTKNFEQKAAFIESEQVTHAFLFKGVLQKSVLPSNQVTANVNVQSTSWEEILP
ncbi:MAG: hypothetical protein HY694_02375 [Deltaproteobacteria bacterium]|nr:hypothetical protein [Deltaproteobacteria bacterium]